MKIGPVEFADGISRKNGWTWLFVSLTIVYMLTFLNFGQSYILREHLQIPLENQGKTAGALAAFGEVIYVLLAGLFGVLIDTKGRKFVFVFGMILFATAYFAYPLATSLPELFIYRGMFGVGAVACAIALATVQSDYAAERSRGMFVAIFSMLAGIGLVTAIFTLGKLPQNLKDSGMPPVEAGTITYWIAAGSAALLAAVMFYGLKGGIYAPKKEKKLPFFQTLAGSIRAARDNPRIALCYAASFASRGDIVVIGIFIAQWYQSAGQAYGIPASEAIAKAGIVIAILQTAGLFFAPIYGKMLDRMDRIVATGIGMGLAAVGYVATLAVDNPFDLSVMIPVAVLMGFGQIAAIISGQTLIGQETTLENRGPIIGMFSLCGALGILFATGVGGYFFDHWRFAAPFILLGVANGIVAVWAFMCPKRPAVPA